MAHACNTSYLGGGDSRITSSKPAWAKLARLSLRNKSTKTRGQAVAQEAENWVSMCEALGPIPSIAPSPQKKKKERKLSNYCHSHDSSPSHCNTVIHFLEL
jgi:hypothetical protein